MEEFLELANRVSWHNATLGACFQLGLNDETIRCDLPMSDFPLIELINLVLHLNCSNFEVEEIEALSKSRRPAPSGTRRVPQLTSCEEPPHTAPTAPTTCATHSAPESSEAPPSSSAQKHRLPQGQARRPRLTQARRPLLCQARWLSPSPSLKRGDYGGGHCGLQPQSALNCLHLQSAILIPS